MKLLVVNLLFDRCSGSFLIEIAHPTNSIILVIFFSFLITLYFKLQPIRPLFLHSSLFGIENNYATLANFILLFCSFVFFVFFRSLLFSFTIISFQYHLSHRPLRYQTQSDCMSSGTTWYFRNQNMVNIFKPYCKALFNNTLERGFSGRRTLCEKNKEEDFVTRSWSKTTCLLVWAEAVL